jgi:methyl-accepting chemotaxis protein
VDRILDRNTNLLTWLTSLFALSALAILLIFSQTEIQRRLLSSLKISQHAQAENEEHAAEERKERLKLQSVVEKYVTYMAGVGQGNLAERLAVAQIAGEDELLVRLGQQLNDTTASLSAMIHQIREASENLTAASSEILAATTHQASGASEQSPPSPKQPRRWKR